MALASEEESAGAAMAREWNEAAARRIQQERERPMKKYRTLEQWFNGHMTVDRGVIVDLPDGRAAELMAGGYVEPVGAAKAEKAPEDEGPQNRRVTTAGTAGPKGK